MGDVFAQTEVVTAIIGAIVGGIIGILGSVSTIAISALINNYGKISIFTNESEIIFHKSDNAGGYEVTEDLQKAEGIEININVDVYNDSGSLKTLGNFQIELIEDRQKKYFPVNQYHRTRTKLSYSLTVPSQTIFPKQPVNIQCKSYLHQIDIKPFDTNIDIFLLADSPKGMKFRSKILVLKKQ